MIRKQMVATVQVNMLEK